MIRHHHHHHLLGTSEEISVKFNSMVGKVDLQEATRLIGEDTSVFNRSSFAKFSLITWSTTFCFLNLCSELSAGYYFRLTTNFGGTELITVIFCPYTRKNLKPVVRTTLKIKICIGQPLHRFLTITYILHLVERELGTPENKVPSNRFGAITFYSEFSRT